LNLRHPCHLNVKFVIDTVDLHLHDIKEFPTARGFATRSALCAVVPFGTLRPCRPFGSWRSGFVDGSTLADLP
jgi:hypothetical protein